jgi:hypothetical protein
VILPEQGSSVVYLSSRFVSGGKEFFDELTCENQIYSDQGIWYPKSCRYERRINGQLQKSELTTVQEALINVPPDPLKFTIEGMDLPAGKAVGLPNGVKYWNGEKLVDRETLPEIVVPSRDKNGWTIAIAFGFAVLAGVSLWVATLRRKK